MAGETVRLAEYAAGLRYDDIPGDVLRRAKDCLIDTVAVAWFGRKALWSRIALGYAAASGAPGRARSLGGSLAPLAPEAAALANGVQAHALELDSLRKPGAGVHPGAILVPAALAVAQENGLDGRRLLTALVAGCEVLFRVGAATRHSAEARGFHAPGLTGPFGSAAAAGRLLGLPAPALASALGIAGSFSGGLLEFSSGSGAMVKRLHLGRGAHSGIAAARLAAGGFTGPQTVLEGRNGFLQAFCPERKVQALVAGLGETFETRNICFKRYPCHITAHTPVYAVECLRREHGFGADEVESVRIEGSRRMAQVNGDRAPADLSTAGYSVPFSVAVALARDAADPENFGESALSDARVRSVCRRIELVAAGQGGHADWATSTLVALKDGRRFERRQASFPGAPDMPLAPEDLERRFMTLTRDMPLGRARRLFARLQRLEDETALDWLHGEDEEQAG